MARIGGKNTRPEIIVRRLLYGMGYRFRLHRRDLPGKPDIVFAGRQKVILVHGCFWHGHGCKAGRLPKSRLDFWAPKIASNRARDIRNIDALRRFGWAVAVVWGCELANLSRLEKRLGVFLERNKSL
jgi:DNA mismatch endonuclease (patch repair protein)